MEQGGCQVDYLRRAALQIASLSSLVQRLCNRPEQWKAFVPSVTQEAFRRGLDCTDEIEVVGDGAEGIWSLQEMVFAYVQTRLEMYHAKKISHRPSQA